MEPAATNLKQAYREIIGLGRLTGHSPGAKAVVRSMRSHLAAIVRSVPKTRRHLSVYHELDPTYYSATSKTFIGSIYRLFGFRDIADAAGASAGTAYPQLSGEYIIAQSPQIIVLADTKCCGQSYPTVTARPGWSTIAAVEHHRVVTANDDVASRWGPRIVQFARTVARIANRAEWPRRPAEWEAAPASRRGASASAPASSRSRSSSRRSPSASPSGRSTSALARSSARRSRTSRSCTSISRSEWSTTP